jgi:hypothetical protein
MSDSRAIAAVTATLQHRLQSALVGEGATVTVTRPGSATNGTPAASVNLFLYQVTPNAAWRNRDLPTRRADGRLVDRPQLALDLHYLLSFYGDEKLFVPQRLLGRASRALHARPVLTRAMIASALADAAVSPDLGPTLLHESDLADAIELVKLTPGALSLEELSKLWSIFFQTPYALSLAYQAAVVLVEDDEAEPEPGLPVSRRNVYVVPFRMPVVDRAVAAAGAERPIVASTTLRILGRQLRGPVTRVRLGASLVDPTSVQDTEILLPLSSLPSSEVRAGVQGVQVVHELLMGTPPAPHRGVESNVVAFILRPTVTSVVATTPQATVAVEVDPPARAGQRLTLLLNERQGDGAYSFQLEPPASDLSTLAFAIAGVQPGAYLLRVRVDGAESPLEIEEDENDPAFGQFTGPEVQIP